MRHANALSTRDGGRCILRILILHPRLASSEVDDSIMGRGEPEISCLRYGVRPRVSDDIRGGISATIDVQVDVTFRSLDRHDVTSKDCSRSVVLHNFHLSCSLARDSNLSSTTTASTRTICGIVPMLQTGDCVRILASLFVADSWVSTDKRQGTLSL